MITEDYVSFETAKLLKEKGFDGETNCYYIEGSIDKNLYYSPIRLNHKITNNEFDVYIDITSSKISAPTLQMAMKWLREVHEIYIEIPIYSIGKPVLYRWNAFKNGRLVTDEEKPKTSNVIIKGDDNNPTVYYYKYEEACEVAIKYCLENLI